MANGYRTLSQHLNDLKKENFSLKLRIYFLEERVQQKGEDSRDDVYRRVSICREWVPDGGFLLNAPALPVGDGTGRVQLVGMLGSALGTALELGSHYPGVCLLLPLTGVGSESWMAFPAQWGVQGECQCQSGCRQMEQVHPVLAPAG